ncbi:MAG: HPF/RaiA family ribosome-associated protein [Gemmatimonadota bacterium]
MKTTPEISFRNVESTTELKAAVERHIEDLQRFYHGIIGCHVMVETPHGRRRSSKQVHVRIEVTVPGRDLVVSRDPGNEPWHADPFLAVGDAFGVMRRRLEDYVRESRGLVKRHEHAPHGRISKLSSDGYGFIRASDGGIIYFHRNSVADAGFEDLSIGDEVRFSSGRGLEGPQATSVHPIGKHHPGGADV